MTLEEMFVEKYTQMEKTIAILEKKNEELKELLDEATEEVEVYEAFIAFLQKHIKGRSYGVFIEFPSFAEDHEKCVEELSTFFEIENEDDCESEDEE